MEEMNMIKMIVSDVDGTLLSHGYINPKCIESIKKAQEKGKRPYQQLLSALLSATIGFIISMFFVWLLKSYIF